MTTDEITRTVDVPLAPAAAWRAFAIRFADWWPREHCFCGEAALDRVFLDPEAGTWGEVTATGDTLPWGAVIEARPGVALALGWQMDATVSPWVPEPDPARASVIDIGFAAGPGGGSRLALRHHGFSRQGEPHATAMRDVMIGLDRWREWLDLFRDFAETAAARDSGAPGPR